MAKITGNDTGGSGLDRCEYKINDGTWTSGDTVTFNSTGSYTLLYRSKDKAGNASAVGTTIVKVDKTIPVDFAIDATAIGIDKIRVKAETTDNHSGMGRYRIYDGTSWTAWMTEIDEIIVGFDRGESAAIKVEARDLMGNIRLVETSISTMQNNPPAAVDDEITILEDSGVKNLNLMENDTDSDLKSGPGEVLTIISVSPLSDNTAGTLLFKNGVATFTPALDYFGKVTFTYTLEDSEGAQDSANVTINVTAVNDTPTLKDDSAQTLYATPVTINVLANDSDKETAALTIASVSLPSNGKVSLTGNKLIYTPDEGFAGLDTFKYMVRDGSINVSATVTVEVSYPKGTNKDTDVFKPAVEIPGVGGGTEPDITNPPTDGTAEVVGDNIFYTPKEGTTGIQTYKFTLNVDGKTTEYEALVFVDPKTGKAETLGYGLALADDRYTVFKNNNLTIQLSEYIDSLTGLSGATITSAPKNGTLSYENGQLVYTPKDDFLGMDGALVTLQIGGEEFAYCVTFEVLDKEHGGFFSWWCLLGWLIAAIALTLIYLKNKIFFAARKARTIVYVIGSVVLLALLCLLRQYYGYIPSILILAGYLVAYYIYSARKAKAE